MTEPDKAISAMSLLELRSELHDAREKLARAAVQSSNGATLAPHKVEFNQWLLTRGIDSEDFNSFTENGKEHVRAQFAEHQQKHQRAVEVAKSPKGPLKLPSGYDKMDPERQLLAVNLATMGADDDAWRKSGFEPPKAA